MKEHFTVAFDVAEKDTLQAISSRGKERAKKALRAGGGAKRGFAGRGYVVVAVYVICI